MSQTLLNHVALIIPISSAAYQSAERFSRQQPTRIKQEQVYYNTLAVCVVKSYLDWIGIQTRLDLSDSWNPVLQLCGDVADLEVAGVGRIECRPVTPEQTFCEVPPEVWSDRKAYVVVELKESSSEAAILGFSPRVDNGILELNELRSLTEFPEYLHSQSVSNLSPIPLHQWLAGLVTQGWQTLDELLNANNLQLNYALRNLSNGSQAQQELTWGRIINLGLQLGTHPLVLLVTLKPKNNTTVEVQVRLRSSDRYLPPYVRLSLVSEEEALQTVTSREQDNWVALTPFEGTLGESFSIRVAISDLIFQEDFII